MWTQHPWLESNAELKALITDFCICFIQRLSKNILLKVVKWNLIF
jgi:hypothetical protein